MLLSSNAGICLIGIDKKSEWRPAIAARFLQLVCSRSAVGLESVSLRPVSMQSVGLHRHEVG